MNKNIFIIGGDLRISYAAQEFKRQGYSVLGFALPAGACPMAEAIEEGMEKSDIVLLPVPVSADKKTLNAPLGREKIYLSSISDAAGDKKIIFGGKVPEGVFSGKVFDYAEREDFAVLNAVITAEGVLEIAMRERECALWGSRVLIVGFGRIGKMCCKMFSGIGASVCASARKSGDIALIKAFGYESYETRKIEDIIADFDIIINTVPQRIITDKALEKVKKGAIIIDTASTPGGVDINAAKALGINALWALSLPGKVAPKTSGDIICDTVLTVLKDMGV